MEDFPIARPSTTRPRSSHTLTSAPSLAITMRGSAEAGRHDTTRPRSAAPPIPMALAFIRTRTGPLLERVLQVQDIAHVERPEELLQHRQVRIQLLQLVEVEVAALLVFHEQVHLAEEVIAVLQDVLVIPLGG